MEKCKEIAFSVHHFYSSTCITVYAECIYVFIIKIWSLSLNVLLTVDKHCSDVFCDKFPMPQTDRKSKQVKEHSDTENFICNQYGKKLAILDT